MQNVQFIKQLNNVILPTSHRSKAVMLNLVSKNEQKKFEAFNEIPSFYDN